MFRSFINTSIFSKTNRIEYWLKQIPAPEKFEYHFHTFDVLSDITFAESDIIVLDLPFDSNNLHTIHNQKKEGTLLIVCVFPEEQAKMTADDYRFIDDLWMNPLKKETATFYFSKVMQQLKLKKDLQLSQKYLDGVIESIPDIVWFKDLSGAHLKVNDSFCQTVGKTKEAIQGQSHYYIWDITKEEYEKGENVCLETDATVLLERKTCRFYEKVKSKNGLRQLITYKSPIFDNSGKPMGTVGIARDVTDLLNMKAELEIVLEHIPFAFLFYDNTGTILNVNKSFEEYFCINKQSIVGREYDEWAFSIFSGFKGNISDNVSEVKAIINNNEKIIKVHNKPVYDIFNKITGYFCIYSDITLEHRMKEKIIHSANTDYLTGLYNRRYLYETINDIKDTSCLGLLCIDIDDFKLINDKYGHKAGDKALVNIAGILSEQFSDQMIFRLGGDEFLVVISDSYSIDKIKEYARNCLTCINKGFEFHSDQINLSASIGIALAADPPIYFDELLKHGDYALYKAKQKGKNQYCIWPD